jgi:hypothetical protein
MRTSNSHRGGSARPGSVDLSALHGELLALRFSARQRQVAPLATAYDRSTHTGPEQRAAPL